MPERFIRIPAAGFCLVAALSGCDTFKKKTQAPVVDAVVPAHVAGTIAERARLETGGDLQVQGYGLVVGLGKNGSSQVPPHLLEYFKQTLARHGIGSPQAGMGRLTPERMLRDLDTSVVLLAGAIPPGAPEGTTFDVYVGALPNTDTRSLDGGALLPSDLRLASGGMAIPGGPTRSLASAGGELFVNPFIDPEKPQDLVKYREGRIIGGGKVVSPRPIHLLLYQPDYAVAQHIQRRLNERFPGLDPVASAKNSSLIEVKIPRAYRADYEHFLQLVMRLPLGMGQAAVEAHARQIAASMELPTANHNELALVWEAIGKQTLPVVQNLYASKNPMVAFYAARTGLRLGEESVAGDLLIRFAGTSNSPVQIPAIEELGRTPTLARASAVLHKLLDDESDLVRVAAYEAMVRRGDRSLISRVDVGGQFTMDLVTSGRGYVIYATQAHDPRLVLFGRDMPVARPVFFSPPDDLVTVSARGGDPNMMVFRKIPRTGKFSDAFYIDFSVRSLITTLGSPSEPGEDGNIKGLNFNYGQVVGILHRMCKENDVNAKFVLQPTPGFQRIYRDVGTLGRPDTPGP